MVEVKEGTTGAVVIDDRYAPLVVSSFIGDVDLSLGTWYEQITQRLISSQFSQGRRVVNIHDASLATRTSAEMRKFWAEMSARNEATMQTKTLANLIVVTNPILRGVITAVSWLNPKVAKLQVFSSLDAAVKTALGLLESAGTPVALPHGGYQLHAQVSQLRLRRDAR